MRNNLKTKLHAEIKSTANVHLWGKLVGQVNEFNNGRIGFNYDPSFLIQGRSISPRYLPLKSGIFEFPELMNMSVAAS